MNRIVLVGRLETTPELRYTSTGIPVANFSLSVRRSIPNGQGRYERDIFRVVTWRKLAETCCKFLERGRMIAVDGKLQNRILSSPNGERRTVVEIHADDVRFLEGAKPRTEVQEEEPAETPAPCVPDEQEMMQCLPESPSNAEFAVDEDAWVPDDDEDSGTPLDPRL